MTYKLKKIKIINDKTKFLYLLFSFNKEMLIVR